MSHYIRSKRSKQDIKEIVNYSVESFGEAQTLKYMAGLESTFQILSENPYIGRAFIHRKTKQEYLRYRYNSHIIYYRKQREDVFIVRILHEKMLPERHL